VGHYRVVDGLRLLGDEKTDAAQKEHPRQRDDKRRDLQGVDEPAHAARPVVW
jgi:hypothetical protein